MTDDRDWLRALVWPDQPQRLDRLDRAIALYRQAPARDLRGDALALLPDALADVPPQRGGLRLSHHRGLSIQSPR